MYMKDRVIAPEDAVRVINEGGWTANSGHCLEELGGQDVIAKDVRATISSTGSLLITVAGVTVDLPSDKVVMLHPWWIEIVRTHMVQQQRKMKDGGGWHDVPKDGPALRLFNRTVERAHVGEQKRPDAQDRTVPRTTNEKTSSTTSAVRRAEEKHRLLAQMLAFVGKTARGLRWRKARTAIND